MILRFIRGLFSETLYVQIWENRIKITHIESRRVYDQKPWIALDIRNSKKQIVVAVGDEAYAIQGRHGTEASNPFSHPRLLVKNFLKAEKVLQHGVRTVCARKVFNPSPVIVIHPREKLEGGLTDIECRLFRELCLGAGAHAVHLHVGEELDVHNFKVSALSDAH
ncbi:rod shape-determining protein [Marinimicrobium agarilyticum]|uniref:rod shape-determining protein n=1 Tax=Marinimicrobium agarilyticum TaxID=306546 RepID=UPI000684B779|nr:rod shape-determining protein [Marinimicrobium agarilyticum]